MHRQQRLQIVSAAEAPEARGQFRVVEMNQRVLGNLDRIITALQVDEVPDGTEVSDAG